MSFFNEERVMPVAEISLSFRIYPSLNKERVMLVAGICNASLLYYKVPIAIGMQSVKYKY